MPVAWFVSPYESSVGLSGVLRRKCAFDAATAQVEQADGHWSEAEIGGDRALVKCRAPLAVLANIATTFQRVQDADVAATWTPTFTTTTGRVLPARPLLSVNRDVLGDLLWGALKARVDELVALADQQGYVRLEGGLTFENRLLLVMLARRGYRLDRVSTGTFPTTTVLDDFNRANGDIGAAWSKDPDQASTMQINTNQATSSPTNYLAAFWNASTYGPDSEAFITIATKSGTFDEGPTVITRMTAFDSGDGYAFAARPLDAGDDEWIISRIDDGLRTQLGATITSEYASGDKLGGESIGDDHTIYKYSSGAWASIGTRTEATYGSAGYIGFYCDYFGRRLDDFGGGTVIAAGLLQPKRLAGPALLTNSAATIYTSAGDSLIQVVSVSNPSGSPVNLTMSVGADAAGTRLFDAFPVPAGTQRDFRMHQPLTDGQTIQAFGSTTGVLNVTLNGRDD